MLSESRKIIACTIGSDSVLEGISVSFNLSSARLLAPIFILHTLITPAWSAPAAKSNAHDKSTQKTAMPVVYDFSTSYCVPCKVIKPIFEEVAREYKGRVDMQEIDAEDEKNKALVDKYQATAFPLIVFVDAHGKRTGDFNRKITKKELVDRVEKLLAK
ncbi:MAG: thioredoxin [Candidatus Melainabacteria bacterium]|nr:MAG: thioredoxin [Candidatus Melainabacteria bacterium]